MLCILSLEYLTCPVSKLYLSADECGLKASCNTCLFLLDYSLNLHTKITI